MFALASCHDFEAVVSGGKDGRVVLWDASLTPLATHNMAALPLPPLNPAVRSVCCQGSMLLVGTAGSEIYELNMRTNQVRKLTEVRAPRARMLRARALSERACGRGTARASCGVWRCIQRIKSLQLLATTRRCACGTPARVAWRRAAPWGSARAPAPSPRKAATWLSRWSPAWCAPPAAVRTLAHGR